MMVRKATKNDVRIIAGLAVLLWDHPSADELADEFSEILSQEDAQVFLKYAADTPVGFAQCQLRHDYVEGTETTPVGYLEGIFVKGCTEFASDCELENADSFRFHMAMDFAEANRIICFTKRLQRLVDRGKKEERP